MPHDNNTGETPPPVPPGLQADAYGYAPSARRRRWLLTVHCPWCSGWHVHRSADGSGGVRQSGCGRLYTLRVIVCAA